MKEFKTYLIDSIIDPERPTLSPQIFEDPKAEEPKIKEEIILRIKAGIEKIDKKADVVDYTLIGSILTKRYTDKSDVDVNVLVGSGQFEKVKDYAMSISGKNIPGTNHPLNFHIVDNKKDFDNANKSADAVFDIKKNKFIRKESNRPFDINQYWNEFLKVSGEIDFLKDELKDDLIDYNQLKKLKFEQLLKLKLLVNKKLKEIEADVEGLTDIYNKVKKDRKKAFEEPLTADDIRQYGSKNRLPENVIYKLLEKHHYLRFLAKIEEIIGEDGKLSKKEAEKLSKFVLGTK